MKDHSNKITLRETLRIHWRAFQDVRRFCGGAAFAVPALHAAFSALSPYVTVYFSARIINELAGQPAPMFFGLWLRSHLAYRRS